MTPRPTTKFRRAGVTLIELVVVIALIGIIGVSLGGFIVPAMKSYKAQGERAALLDAAESALRRMGRDVRLAVPNSVRITNTANGFALESIPSADGARYCTAGTANCSAAVPTPSNPLTIASSDSVFDVLGCFRNTNFLAGTGGPYRLVINNFGSEVYTSTGASSVITPVATTFTFSLWPNTGVGAACGTLSLTGNTYNRHRVTLSAGQTFTRASPRQRVYVVQDSAAPVSYVCDTVTGTLKRYAGYKMVDGSYSPSTQPTDPAATPLSAATSTATVADSVTACSLTTTTSTLTTTGIATFSLTLGSGGGSVTLLYQVQIDNSL